MKNNRLGIRKKLVGYLFLSPALIMLLIFMFIPLIWNVVLSFYEWNGNSAMTFVGVHNFINIFTEESSWMTLFRSAFIAFISLIVSLILGLGYALLLFRLTTKEQTIFRFIFFSPAMMPMTIIGLLFVFVLSSEGLVNSILGMVGLECLQHAWLADPDVSLWVIAVIQGWRQSGVIMMLFVTAIMGVPASLFECAKLEGANYWEQIKRIILPLIKPTFRLTVSMLVMWGFKTYDLVYVMTKGGPGEFTYTTPLKIVRLGFNNNDYGTAAALGTLLVIVVTVFVVAARVLLKGEDYEY